MQAPTPKEKENAKQASLLLVYGCTDDMIHITGNTSLENSAHSDL